MRKPCFGSTTLLSLHFSALKSSFFKVSHSQTAITEDRTVFWGIESTISDTRRCIV